MQLRRFLAVPLAVLCLSLAARARAGVSPHPDFEVTVSGHGKPVIFIPGLSTPGAIWRPVVDQLQGAFQCHVVSLAGFGEVKPTGSDPFLPRVRDELLEYIRAEKLDHPLIVGHSLGGFVGLWLAETAPDVPGGLVIVDGLPFLPAVLDPTATPESTRARVAPIAQRVLDAGPAQFIKVQNQTILPMVTSPENARKVMALCQDSDPQTVTRALEEMVTNDLRPDLAKIKCPVLVLVALADKVADTPKATVLANYRRQYQNLPGVRFTEFDESKHFIMVDDLPKLMDVLRGELLADSEPK